MYSHTFDTPGDVDQALILGQVADGDVVILDGLTAVVCGIDGYFRPITVMQSGGLRQGRPFTCLAQGETWADALDGRYARAADVAISLGVASLCDRGSPEYRRCLSIATEQGWEGFI